MNCVNNYTYKCRLCRVMVMAAGLKSEGSVFAFLFCVNVFVCLKFGTRTLSRATITIFSIRRLALYGGTWNRAIVKAEMKLGRLG